MVGVPARTTRDIHLHFFALAFQARGYGSRFAATSEALRSVPLASTSQLISSRAISARAALTSGKSHDLQGGVRLKVASACSSRSFVKLNATEFGPYAGTAAAEPFTAGSVARCGFFAISSAPRATTSSMAAA